MKVIVPISIGLFIAAIVTLLVVIIVKFTLIKNPHLFFDPYEIPYADENIEWNNISVRFENRSECTSPTIFVAISSYRDPELCITLKDVFRKAFNKKRVIIGVVEQNDPSDPYTSHIVNFDIPDSVAPDQIRVKKILYRDARGPTHARSICETLYKDEDYYLLVDSHMRFDVGWDCDLIDMILRCPRPQKTIITCYPEGYSRTENKDGSITYGIKMRRGYRIQKSKGCNKEGIVEFCSVGTNTIPPLVPPYTGFWAACFSFSSGRFVKEIPYPNNTPYMFFGEEMFMGMRAFTHGWDIRAPRFSVVYHNWMRGYRKTFSSVEPVRKKSVEHVKDVMMGRDISDSRHALGTVRSKDEYFDYIGVTGCDGTNTRSTSNEWELPKGFKDIHDEFVVVAPHNNIKLLKQISDKHHATKRKIYEKARQKRAT